MLTCLMSKTVVEELPFDREYSPRPRHPPFRHKAGFERLQDYKRRIQTFSTHQDWKKGFYIRKTMQVCMHLWIFYSHLPWEVIQGFFFSRSPSFNQFSQVQKITRGLSAINLQVMLQQKLVMETFHALTFKMIKFLENAFLAKWFSPKPQNWTKPEFIASIFSKIDAWKISINDDLYIPRI